MNRESTTRIGFRVPPGLEVGPLVQGIVGAERAGFDSAWISNGAPAPDQFVVLASAAAQTDHIELGTSITPIFPRHPLTMAQAAIAVHQLAPGRFNLGIGSSHKPYIEAAYGIPFSRPHTHLREYLTILNAIFQKGAVDFNGELLESHVDFYSASRIKVLSGALREKAYHLSGELADGAISWSTPLPYIRDVAVPALKAGAAFAGRDKPKLIAHVPIVVSENKAAVHEAAVNQIGFFQKIPYYSRVLQDSGFEEAAGDEFSERMTDALVVYGKETDVADRVLSMRADFGVDEIIAEIIKLPGDLESTFDSTFSLLGELASGP